METTVVDFTASRARVLRVVVNVETKVIRSIHMFTDELPSVERVDEQVYTCNIPRSENCQGAYATVVYTFHNPRGDLEALQIGDNRCGVQSTLSTTKRVFHPIGASEGSDDLHLLRIETNGNAVRNLTPIWFPAPSSSSFSFAFEAPDTLPASSLSSSSPVYKTVLKVALVVSIACIIFGIWRDNRPK